MSRMLSKMNLISVVQQLPKEDIETIQGYVEMIEEENETLYQSLKKQKEELRDYLKARIEVCDNRLSMPFCNPENATKERLILSQCLDKLEELEGVKYE